MLGRTLSPAEFPEVYGQSSNATFYSSNTVILTNNVSASAAGGDPRSATIRVLASGVRYASNHLFQLRP
jgi:hypothetical protein